MRIQDLFMALTRYLWAFLFSSRVYDDVWAIDDGLESFFGLHVLFQQYNFPLSKFFGDGLFKVDNNLLGLTVLLALPKV